MNNKVLFAFDISTKPGYAIFVEGKLYKYGTLFAQMKDKDFGAYPMNFVHLANHIVDRIEHEVLIPFLKELVSLNILATENEGWDVVVEETTASKDNYSQKKLEFTHYGFLSRLRSYSVTPMYIRDGVWKSLTGARQTTEERELNKKIKKYKDTTGEKLAKIDLDDGRGAKVVGKKGQKHYSIRAVKTIFDIDLMRQDEDAAEAMLIGEGFLMLKAKGVLVQGLCDGTKKGGLMSTLRLFKKDL